MSAPVLWELPMTHDGSPVIIVGAGAAARTVPQYASTTVILLIDARVHQQHPHLAARARHVYTVDPDVDSPPEALQRVCADFERETATGSRCERDAGITIIGVGGGSVLDTAKLLRLRLSSASCFRAASHAARSFGVAMIPQAWGRGVAELVLIPTTLGTGSEASAVACLITDGAGRARRLIAGSPMKAQTVVLDRDLTRSLDGRSLREGAAEVLLRTLGVYIGSTPREIPDAAAEELTSRVATLAERGNRDGFDDATREALAVASSETHTGWALVGRSPYGAKHWYLANELSSATGERKVPTTLRLLPAIWQRIVDGDSRLGDATRLTRLWRIIAAALGLDHDPVRGAAEWSQHWGISVPPVPLGAAEAAARVCFEMWGGARPALPGLTETEILALYATGITPVPTAERRQRAGEEVSEW